MFRRLEIRFIIGRLAKVSAVRLYATTIQHRENELVGYTYTRKMFKSILIRVFLAVTHDHESWEESAA